MQAHEQLPRSSSGVIPALNNFGFEIWDVICAQLSYYEPNVFRTQEVVKLIHDNFGWGRRTAQSYTMAVLNNIMLTQDKTNPCLRKVRMGLYQLLKVNYDD